MIGVRQTEFLGVFLKKDDDVGGSNLHPVLSKSENGIKLDKTKIDNAADGVHSSFSMSNTHIGEKK